MLDGAFKYVSSSPEASVSGQTVTWTIGEIQPGKNVTVTVVVTVTANGTFNNTATVKCDAVAGVEYAGKVASVAPTGVPGSSGTSYSIEADIDGEDGKVLVGMSAKLSIISDKRENALTITYDALTTDDDGNDAIYVAEKDESGVYRAKLVKVEIGLETDYEIEIISSEISAGMYVLTNTTMLSDGDMVVINENEEESEVEGAE